MAITPDIEARYNEIVATLPEVERKGKTTPYTSLNGHMFSFLSKEGTLGLRLDQGQIEQLINDQGAKRMEQHGRTMQDFAEVPKKLFESDEVFDWFAKSFEHTSTLKPKPTKK